MEMQNKLIQCVRTRPVLYKEHKSSVKRQLAWEEIATELGITAAECKKKWTLLRNAFLHARARRRSATAEEAKLFKKWTFEDEMAFLVPFMSHKTTVSDQIEKCSNGDSDCSVTETPELSLYEDSSRATKRRFSHDNWQQDIALTSPTKSSQTKPESNDIDLFFDSIVETVKKFPKLEQIKLKMDIMRMVNEVEMRLYLESDRSTGSPAAPSPPAAPASPAALSPRPPQRRAQKCYRGPGKGSKMLNEGK